MYPSHYKNPKADGTLFLQITSIDIPKSGETLRIKTVQDHSLGSSNLNQRNQLVFKLAKFDQRNELSCVILTALFVPTAPQTPGCGPDLPSKRTEPCNWKLCSLGFQIF